MFAHQFFLFVTHSHSSITISILQIICNPPPILPLLDPHTYKTAHQLLQHSANMSHGSKCLACFQGYFNDKVRLVRAQKWERPDVLSFYVHFRMKSKFCMHYMQGTMVRETIYDKRPMGHIVHLRKQFKSINIYNYHN